MEVDLSTKEDFSSIAVSLKFSESSQLFKAFDEGRWKDVNALDELADKTVAIDIRDLVDGKGLTYFGRYRVIENNEPQEWIGFCIGSSVSSASQFKAVDGLKLVDARKRTEISSLRQGKSTKVSLVGVNLAGQEVVLSALKLSTSSQLLTVKDGDSLEVSSQLEVPMTAVVTAVGMLEGEDYTLRREVFLYPISIRSMSSTLPETITEEEAGDKLKFKINAVTTDGDTLAKPANASAALLYGESEWISLDSAKNEITIDTSKAESSFVLFLLWKGQVVSWERHYIGFKAYTSLDAEITFSSAGENAQIYQAEPSTIYSGGTYLIQAKRNFRWDRSSD